MTWGFQATFKNMQENQGTPQRRRSRFGGFTVQLFLLIILPSMILLIGIAVLSTTLHQRAMRDLVGERNSRLAQALASEVNLQLQSSQSTLHILANQYSVEADPQELMESPAQTLLDVFNQGLAMYSSDGKMLTGIGSSSLWESNPQIMQIIHDLLQNGQSNEAVLQFTGGSANEVTAYLAASADQGKVFGVGAFTVSHLMNGILGSIEISGSPLSIMVVNQSSQVIFLQGELNPQNTLTIFDKLLSAQSSSSVPVTYQLGPNGEMLVYSTISFPAWDLIIEEPWYSAVSPLLRSTQFVPLTLIPVSLVMLVAIWFGIRRVIRPLQSLESKAGALVWGDYEGIQEPVGGITEVQNLQTELMHMATKLRQAQQSIHGYIGAMTRGQEEERRRLARELHDETLQSIIALNQRIQMLASSVPPEQKAQVEELHELSMHTITDLRRLTGDLRPTYLEELGLGTALKMLAQDIEKNKGIKVEFISKGKSMRLPDDVELAIYRIAQESLNNVVHHSGASEAMLSITYSGSGAKLSIQDNGKGFTVPATPDEFGSSGHYGLMGIHERVEQIDAHMRIESNPGEGTRIEVEWVGEARPQE
jgi:signal transduction histidine kinase